MNIAQRLKELRENKKLRQQDIADLLGINQSAYSHIEKNRRDLTQSHIIKLCEFYNISADYILGLTDEKRKLW